METWKGISRTATRERGRRCPDVIVLVGEVRMSERYFDFV
jgi:hypothetical protein